MAHHRMLFPAHLIQKWTTFAIPGPARRLARALRWRMT